MLLLAQTLLGLGIKKRKKGKLCVRGNPWHHSPLCFPFTLYGEGSPSLWATFLPLEGEKRRQTGDFIQDTIFHQVLLLLQELEGNSGNSLSQSISYFCFLSRCPSSAGSGTCCPQQRRCGASSVHSHSSAPYIGREVSSSPGREEKAGNHQQGQCLRTVPEDSACVHPVPHTPETCSL